VVEPHGKLLRVTYYGVEGEAIYALFRAVIASQGTPASSLQPLNRTLSEAMAAAGIRPAAEGFTWGWPDDEPQPMRILWSIARSAAELLTGPDLDRVKFCPGAGCAGSSTRRATASGAGARWRSAAAAPQMRQAPAAPRGAENPFRRPGRLPSPGLD
jgi:predicted RNA-binding Zn ribbon-like protein